MREEIRGISSEEIYRKVGYTADLYYGKRMIIEDTGIKLHVQSYSRFIIEYKGKEYKITLRNPWALSQIGRGGMVSWDELKSMSEFLDELRKEELRFMPAEFCNILYPVLCDETRKKMTDAELNRLILMLRYRLQYQYILFKYSDPDLIEDTVRNTCMLMPCLLPSIYDIDYPQVKEIEFLLMLLLYKTGDNKISLEEWFTVVEHQFPWIKYMTETEIAAFEFKMIRDMGVTACPLTNASMFIGLARDDIIIISSKSLGLREVIDSNHKYKIDNIIDTVTDISLVTWLAEVKRCMRKIRVCQKLKI